MAHNADMKAPNSARSARAYGAARAHSRLVAVLKFALPTIAIVGLLAMGAQFYISRLVLPDEVSVDLSQTVINDGNLVMADPEMTGSTSDNRAYSMTAQRAVQSLSDQASVLLEEIRADFELRDGVTAKLVAPKGTYNRDANALGLQGPSTFATSDGVSMQFDDANIDVEAGNFETDKPVKIDRNGTIINAGSMKISDNGDIVVFETNVRITIPADAVPETAAPNTQPDVESTAAQ